MLALEPATHPPYVALLKRSLITKSKVLGYLVVTVLPLVTGSPQRNEKAPVRVFMRARGLPERETKKGSRRSQLPLG